MKTPEQKKNAEEAKAAGQAKAAKAKAAKADEQAKAGDQAKGPKQKAPEEPQGPIETPRFEKKYQDEVVPALKQKFGLKNIHQVPRITKITLNMGVGKAVDNKKRLEEAVQHMTSIAGQKPVVTLAKTSVAGFKLREGMPIGCKVDLRGHRMWEFLDRLVSLAIPRIRDFRGIKGDSFDGRGNFSMGLAEQSVFPEITLDRVEFAQGLDVTIVMTGGSDKLSYELLAAIGMPFRKN
jgi:large subunit ribosomal protein L5